MKNLEIKTVTNGFIVTERNEYSNVPAPAAPAGYVSDTVRVFNEPEDLGLFVERWAKTQASLNVETGVSS